MKIGIVVPSVPGYSETFFNSKIKGLQANGFEVILFSKSKIREKYPLCKTVFAPDFSLRITLLLDVIVILKNCIFHFSKAKRLFNLNKKDGLDYKKAFKNVLINSYFLPYELTWLHFGFGTMALKSENVAQAIGAKMAVSFRGFDLYVYPIKFPDCYRLLFSKKVKYHVLSDGMKEIVMKYNVSPELIFKISPAIDIEFFKKNKNFSENSVIQFITVSRLHWIKGLEYILEAFSLFKKQKIPFHFTIVGDGVEKEKLMFAVHQLGISEDVTFTSKIEHNKVRNYMEKSNYYIQYSLQEGFCNAVLEAQAMGLLCIVSDADGLKENVLHNKTGWVVPKRNPILLAEKITEVVRLSENEKFKIRENAIERVKNEFNITTQIEYFKSFYTD